MAAEWHDLLTGIGVSMAKQCMACGMVARDDAWTCSGCGGNTWRAAEASRGRLYSGLGIGLLVAVLIAVWFYMRR